MAIFNQYKDTWDDFIDSLNLKSLNQEKLINVNTCNTSRSKTSLADILKKK